MYNKNTQQNKHKALANLFNKKKTREDDITRFQNIHKKITNVQHLNFTTEISNEEKDILIPTEDIYKLDNFKTSTNLPLNFDKEELTNKIPKIHLKDIIIPFQNESDNFDLNTINNTISVPVNMNLFIGDEFNEGDVNRLKKKKVTKIYHVYQQKYAYNVNVTGFGDFIRGCFFVLQFCNKYNFSYDFLIYHPIAFFLEKFKNSYNHNTLFDKLLSDKNIMFTQCNLKDTIFNKNNNNIDGFILSNKPLNDYVDYLCNLKVINNSLYSYNTLFPYDDVSLQERETIKMMLEPTDEMKLYVEETTTSLDISIKKYIVIHIRSGDVYLKNETKIFDSNYFKFITNEIFHIINKHNFDVLLIADNNEIKYLICEIFPNIKTLYKDITHLGEGIDLEIEKVKNTLLDFYLMANSSLIYSFTVYPHGTGFSYWCSKVYDIPYTCKYINIK